jgi:hypothetical protein
LHPGDRLVRVKYYCCLPDGNRLVEHTGAGAPICELMFAMATHREEGTHGTPATVGTHIDLPTGKGKIVANLDDRARSMRRRASSPSNSACHQPRDRHPRKSR